jgi:hypothetical protein
MNDSAAGGGMSERPVNVFAASGGKSNPSQVRQKTNVYSMQ